MTAIARRLDPCVNWFKLLARTQGRVLWLFPALLAFGWLASVYWADALDGLSWRLSDRSANAALRAEARRLGLDFDRVVADPAAATGKPVAWCVSSNDGEHGSVDEKAAMPVVWSQPSELLKTNNGSHGYCWKELAVVVGVDRGAVVLRPVERL